MTIGSGMIEPLFTAAVAAAEKSEKDEIEKNICTYVLNECTHATEACAISVCLMQNERFFFWWDFRPPMVDEATAGERRRSESVCVCVCVWALVCVSREGYKWGLRCRRCKRRGKRSVTCAAVSRSAPCEFAHPFGGGNATDTTVAVYLNIVKTHALCYIHLYAFYTPPHLPPGKQTSSSPARVLDFPTVNYTTRECAQTWAHAQTRTLVSVVCPKVTPNYSG